jgi:hypothetical protein
MYKVVERLVPGLPTDNFVKLARPKRNIKAKYFEKHITSNIVEKHTCNNTKGLELPDYKKQQYQPWIKITHMIRAISCVDNNHKMQEIVRSKNK